ncbi:helix-turn-helix domain-containing protein [Actinomadura rubrisoli]|uniref:XRE family transcriptional regulator n=1 Tax=Actinomadura rubrisoli TaxID=2530368 RepID=A0A4R5ABN1_9ACTN|nr:helix-turn-helix transcriptional regulator [Actinomadura rubrisoli]TDD69783.1 XRE family transcriptional regulator [Actinomadura rubrisoli]
MQPSQAAKKAFAIRLKDLRKNAGLSGVALAKTAGWHKTKVSKIEHATTAPSEEDIRAWARACGVEALIPELVAEARQVEAMWTEWRRVLAMRQPALQLSAIREYENTQLLRIYEPLIIPGIIQTFDYAKAMFIVNARIHGLPLEDVDEAARNRLARQYLVTEGRGTYSLILEAAALRIVYGDAQTMSAQLDFIEDLTAQPNFALGIIPFYTPRRQLAGDGFYLFDEAEVRQEFWPGAYSSKRPEDTMYFGRMFNMLREHAVYGDQARREIASARDGLHGELEATP